MRVLPSRPPTTPQGPKASGGSQELPQGGGSPAKTRPRRWALCTPQSARGPEGGRPCSPHLHLHAIEAQPVCRRGRSVGREQRPGVSRWLPVGRARRGSGSLQDQKPAPGLSPRPSRCPAKLPRPPPGFPVGGPAWRCLRSDHTASSPAPPGTPEQGQTPGPSVRGSWPPPWGPSAPCTPALLTRGSRGSWRHGPGKGWRPARPRASARAC